MITPYSNVKGGRSGLFLILCMLEKKLLLNPSHSFIPVKNQKDLWYDNFIL
jgi:hypothetical protein